MPDTLTKSKKQFTAVIVFAYLLFCGAMIAGTFFDLQIDKALFNYESRFGYFFEQWGVLPSYIAELGAFSAVIACMHKNQDFTDIITSVFPALKNFSESGPGKKVFFIIHKVVYLGLAFGLYNGSKVSINYVFKRFYGHKPQTIFIERGVNPVKFQIVYNICIVALAALTVLLFYLIKRKLNPQQLKLMEFMAGVALLMLVVATSIDIIKDIFTRIRFREMIAFSHGILDENGMSDASLGGLKKEMVADTDFSAFDFWFKKGNDMGRYGDATSFPSGHTSNASYSLLLIPLFYKGQEVSKAYKRLFIPASILGIAYVCTVAVSRLVMGAHYLTDVSAAAIIMLTGMLAVYALLSKCEGIYNKNKS